MAAQQPDQQLLGGGVAGPAGAEESEDLTAANGEIHTAHGGLLRLGIGVCQVANVDDVLDGVYLCLVAFRVTRSGIPHPTRLPGAPTQTVRNFEK